MVKPGDVIVNRVTGSRIQFLETACSTDGARLKCRMVVRVRGPLSVKHFHPRQEETLLVERGRVRVDVDGRTQTLTAGESTTVGRGQAHRYWNESDDDAALVVETRPALRSEDWMEQMFGWCNVTNRRASRLPLHHKMGWSSAYETYEAGIPLSVHRFFSALFMPIARLFGYRAYDPALAAAARQDGPVAPPRRSSWLPVLDALCTHLSVHPSYVPPPDSYGLGRDDLAATRLDRDVDRGICSSSAESLLSAPQTVVKKNRTEDQRHAQGSSAA